MSKEKVYYHILEHGNYGEIGYHGYELSEDTAREVINRLTSCFPDVTFEIYPYTDSNEPPIVTI